MSDLDTHLKGKPEDIRALGTWIRETAAAMDTLAGSVTTARNTGASAWHGGAGQGFMTEASRLVTTADEAHTTAEGLATEIDGLASKLTRIQSDLASVLTTASSAGLDVSGTKISDPGGRLTYIPSTNPFPTRSELASDAQLQKQVTDQNAKVTAFEQACSRVSELFKEWKDAIPKHGVQKQPKGYHPIHEDMDKEGRRVGYETTRYEKGHFDFLPNHSVRLQTHNDFATVPDQFRGTNPFTGEKTDHIRKSKFDEDVDVNIGASIASDKASVDAALFTAEGGNKDYGAYGKAQFGVADANAGYNVGVTKDGLTAGVSAHAGVYVAKVEGQYKNDYGTTLAGNGYIGAEANADAGFSVGRSGINAGAHLDAFVGGKAEASVSQQIGPVNASIGGEVSYGIGAHFNADAQVSKDKVDLSLDMGATLGIGGGFKINIDFDPTFWD